MPLRSGQILQERYRIVALLAQGGMGAVYRAIDRHLDHEVAIKENLYQESSDSEVSTSAELSYSERRREQFEFEARVLAKLRHPGLPKVTDHFIIPGQGQYLVMEFIEGETLRDRLMSAGKMSAEEAIRICLQVCDVLIYLHGQSPAIVHRDIKPANLRTGEGGRVVLVDFGISKPVEEDKTRTGAQGVTPGYSPLEQYGGALHTDPRSDIHALGATLYSMLTGHVPPSATDRVVGQPVERLEAQVPGASVAIQAIVDRAMALLPGDRFQSAEEMRRALLEELDNGDASATLIRRPGAHAAERVPATPPPEPAPAPAPVAPPLTPRPSPAPPASPSPSTVPPRVPDHALAPTTESPRRSKFRGIAILAILLLAVGSLAAFIYYIYAEKKGQAVKPVARALAAPTDVAVSSVSGDGAEITWNWSGDPEADGFSAFEVQVAAARDFEPSSIRVHESIEDRERRHVDLRGLAPGSEYFVRVRVKAGGSSYSDSETLAFTTKDAREPLPRPEIGEVSATATSISIAWAPADAAQFAAYEVHLSTDPGFMPQASTRVGEPIDARTRTALTIPDLQCGTTYRIIVLLRSPGGDDRPSLERSVATKPCGGGIALLPIASATETAISLAWTAADPSDFAAYEVHCSKHPGFQPSPMTRYRERISRAQTTAVTVDGLDCDTAYYFRIVVQDPHGRRQATAEQGARTLPCPRRELRLDPISNVTATSARLSWTPSDAPDFQEFQVHVAREPRFAPSRGTRFGEPIRDRSRSGIEVSGLVCDTPYYFKVLWIDGKGQEHASEEQAARTLPCPQAITLHPIEWTSSTTARVSWTPTSTPAFREYEVHASKTPGFRASPQTRVGEPNRDPRSTAMDVPDLTCETRYSFRVLMRDAAGNESESAEVSSVSGPCAITSPLRVSTGDELMKAMRLISQASVVPAGLQVFLAPGVYQIDQPLWIGKAIEVASTDPKQARIEFRGRGGIVLESDTATLRGMTIQAGDLSSAIVVNQGSLTIDGCNLGSTSSAHPCVSITRSGSLVLKGSSVTSGSTGILIQDSGNASLESSSIESKESCLEARNSATADLTDCRIRSEKSGVYLHDGGQARLKRCTISDCVNGVTIKAGSRAELDGCQVEGNRGAGLHAAAGATILVTGCRIRGNAGGSISAETGAVVDKRGRNDIE